MRELHGKLGGDSGQEGSREGEGWELCILWRQKGARGRFGASDWHDQLCILDRTLFSGEKMKSEEMEDPCGRLQ